MAALAIAARSEDPLALKPPAVPARAVTRAIAVVTGCAIGALASSGSAEAADPVTTVLDRTNTEPVDVAPGTERAQARLARALGGGALLENDPVTGTPRIVARLNGFLTTASGRDPETIALTYVRDHARAFGLVAGDFASLRLSSSERAPDGTTHLSWTQDAAGLTNVDGGLHAAVTPEGRLLNVRGGVVPSIDADFPEPLVSAAIAYSAALPGTAPAPHASAPRGTERATSFADGGSAALVRYQDNGHERIGWRVLAPASSEEFYDAIVDARTGSLQRRINRVRFASHVNHFDVNPRAEGGDPTLDEVPAHWLDGGTDLHGPYVHAVSDLDDSIKLANGAPPFDLTEEPSDEDAVESIVPSEDEPQWLFNPVLSFCSQFCSWSASERDTNREFSTAQLFWYANTFRDHLAQPPISFTGANGGFEGVDPVLAQSLDGATTNPSGSTPDLEHRNNASMLTLPDGYRGLMQVHLFSLGGRRYDGSHDAALVFHEYTHGLTDRLVTDVDGYASMFGAQPSAMAEGISDFYALDFLAEWRPALVPDTIAPGEVHFGQWLQREPETKGLSGTLRTQGVDCAVGDLLDACPGTAGAGPGGYDYGDFGHVDTQPEIHSDGEIWAETLWSIRTAIGGADPTTEELARVRRYVTDGLRFSPDNPTVLDMRNAILQAAVAAGAAQDLTTLWTVFASRGMGWSASTSGVDDVSPHAAFDMPPPPVLEPPPTVTPPTATPTPTPKPPVAKVTSLIDSKLTAKRNGLFKVTVAFGDAAPAGDARITVLRKGKRLARASTPVRVGRTVTKTLKLTKKGRKAIKPGRSKMVTLELRLPGGEKFKKTLKLARKKR